MVKLGGPAVPFCIDATETTNAEYEAFWNSGVAPGVVPTGVPVAAGCAPDDAGTPLDTTPLNNWTPPPGHDNFPVANVNWCQAYSFCKWAGKRLCGQIGGGAVATSNRADAAQSQWFYACSAGGSLTYPYGDTFVSSTCGGQAANSSSAIVGSHPQCVGGFAGVVDMSGSLWEWIDACNSADANSACDAMGGGYDSAQSDLACAGERPWGRTAAANDIGFRCCLDL